MSPPLILVSFPSYFLPSLQYVPPDICICNFVLEQSLSVRALQEMLANAGQNSEGVSAALTRLIPVILIRVLYTVSQLAHFSRRDVLLTEQQHSF